jgi:DNA-binding GntR family transcriptional regulator
MTTTARSLTITRPKDVWEQVCDDLRSRIVLGELAPGERLVETDLAQQCGVSRGPVRTALLSLEQVGLVTSSSRRGVEVARFSLVDITELFAVRTALEALAVEEAAKRCTPAMIEQLKQHLDELQGFQQVGRQLEAVEADLAFHRELCEFSGNGRLVVAWNNLADQLEVVMASVHRIDPTVADNHGEHRDILVALSSGDSAGASSALRSHLTRSCNTFVLRSNGAAVSEAIDLQP